MRSRTARAGLVVVSAVIALAGCTSSQGSTALTEKSFVGTSAENLGLTQLAVAPESRRIWSGPGVDNGARPSPDGRFLSLTDWNTGGLVLRNLSSGATRTIIRKTWEASNDLAESSIISSDGKSVAYGWHVANTNESQVRIADLAESDLTMSRVLYGSTAVRWVNVHAWTRDGSEVIATISPNTGPDRIVALLAGGRGVRTVRILPFRSAENVSVSPDGRWIAYDLPTNDAQRDVHVVGIKGDGDNVVARTKGDDVVMGWAKNAGRLLVTSERNGIPSMWALTIVDGKRIGDPILVRSSMWRTMPAGMSADGRVFYSVLTGERDLYSVPIGAGA